MTSAASGALLSLAAGMTPPVRPTPTRAAAALRSELFASGDLYATRCHSVLDCRPLDSDTTAPVAYQLVYMPMRNRVETARLLLEEAGAPYSLEVVGWEPWCAHVKATVPLGKLPVLRDYDGRGGTLGQEQAIVRCLARRLGLAGRTEVEEATADQLYQQLWCTLRNNGLTHDGEEFSPSALRPGADAPAAGAWPRYRDLRRLNAYTAAERSCAALGVFEEALGATGTGFLVGAAVSYVDLALLHVLLELTEEGVAPDFATRFGLPRLGRFYAEMTARPRLEAYLKSERRMPRYLRPGYTYAGGNWLAAPDSARPGVSGSTLSAAFLAREQSRGSGEA
jgi:glutathione S-transferase